MSGAISPVGADWPAVIESACTHAPYLSRLCARFPDTLDRLCSDGPVAAFRATCAHLENAAALPQADAMAQMRKAKGQMHLTVALADLAGRWGLDEVTRALSDFADQAVKTAVGVIARDLAASGDLLAGDDPARGPIPGLILIAMGKHGAFELNYSSDIDVTVFYDRSLMATPPGREAGRLGVRIAQLLVKLLEEQTADGYVFRTDLRLRPDPGSTPPAVSTASAEHYYQTLGQNWERAAFIKARVCGGDPIAGAEFLAGLQSFIWRRHLDYAAIADVHSIKRQIRSVKRSADLDEPVFDVKLGRGGIRDIELFAQTQQLILGGRISALRVQTTRGALLALSEHGRVDGADRAILDAAYEFLRGVEHRIQMRADEQTHKTPSDPAARADLAALCGFSDLAALDAALIAVRQRVAVIDRALFPDDESLADPLGSLVFTGVEDDPDTLATLRELGYQKPEAVTAAVRGWHHGRVRAMRSERARELLTVLTPAMLRAIAASGAPDAAFQRFADFFAALPAGVQTLSLFKAHPRLLADLSAAFAVAPRLAALVGRRPALLDAMMDFGFERPLADDPPDQRANAMRAAVGAAGGFEAALNTVRRLQREEAFRIDWQTLSGRAPPEAAGASHADLAEACLQALAQAAVDETARRIGPAPGAFTVLALGKFGGRELAQGSDLDITVVYDAPDGAGADYFTRLTQRLIAALSAPTEEGLLYEVDMQLRPSGSKGPVAVSKRAFERYYADEAWTWELLALTRLRAVAGDPALGNEIEALARARLVRPMDRAKIFADVAAMRARMDKERPAKGRWDLKLYPGGFVDVEFIAQAMQLVTAARAPEVLHPNTSVALAGLTAAGALAWEDAEPLLAGWRLYSQLQQWLRIVWEGQFQPEAVGEAVRLRLARALRRSDFTALEHELAARQDACRARFAAILRS